MIDIIRRALLSQTEAEIAAGQPQRSDAVLSSAFEQMLHWGIPRAASGIKYDKLVDNGKPGRPVTASTGFTWRLLWRSIKRIARGELRLNWAEPNDSARLSHLEESAALLPMSPVNVTAPAPAPMPPSNDQPPPLNHQPEPERPLTSAQDLEPAAIQPAARDQPEPAAESPAPPSITAHLLGSFSFSVNDATVQSWPTGKGRAVLKYMLAHHDQPIPRDVLMDAFWPQAGPESARNSLNVALYGLRQALKTVTDKPVILFEEGAYGINPEFDVWVDVDDDRHVRAGRRLEANGQIAEATADYEDAIELYQGDFLAGDPYEEWPEELVS